jgi:hypothetical protein
MKTSFAPKDFGTGRWDGGPATITRPRFEYRKINDDLRAQVSLFLEYMDAAGDVHPAKFDVGSTKPFGKDDWDDRYLVIRDSAAEDADEAETGCSFSHIDPTSQYKVRSNSEFAAFINSLVNVAGFSEAKVATGDISVVDGLQVIVKPTPRTDGDRFPLLLVTELQKTGKPSTSKPASAAKPAAGAKKPAPQPDPEEEEGGELDADTEAARDYVLGVVSELEADTAVGIGKLVTGSMQQFKTDKKRSAAVVGLLQNADFHGQFADLWSYDKKAKKVSPV